MATLYNFNSAVQTGLLPGIYLEKQFLRFLHKKLVMVPLAKRSTIPENSGKIVRWNFFVAPTTAINNLTAGSDTEGTFGTHGTAYTVTSTTATLLEFKNWMDYSKVFKLITQAGSVDEISRVMAYEAAYSFDSNLMYYAASTSTTVDAGTAMTAEALRQGVASLENADVYKHPATPGGAFYAAVLSAEAAYDMMGEGAPVWFQAKSSDYQAALITPWDGTTATSALYNAIVKVSNNIMVATVEDYNLVIGDEAIGCASIGTDPMGPNVIHTPPEQNIANPVRSSGTLGWWGMFIGALLSSTRIVAIRSDAGVHTNAISAPN